MKTWYEIKAAASDKGPTEIYIYGDIGSLGVSAQAFAAELKAIPTDREILLRIASNGGSVTEGLAIHALLAARRSKVTAQIDSISASMASVIMCAAGKIRASKNAWVMIHNAAGGGFGDGDDLRKVADILDKMRDQIAAVYEAKTGKKREEIIKAMDEETWLAADEALAFGLVDEVTEAVEAAASCDVSRFKRAPQAISGGNTASTNNQPNKVHMKNLIKALVDARLVASIEVSEENAVAQLQAALAAQAATAKAQADKITALEAEQAEAKKKAADALAAEAASAVEACAKAGRIKDDNDLRAKWVSAYIHDPVSTKAMLENLPEAKAPRGAAPLAATPPTAQTDKPEPTASVWAKQLTK